MRPAGWGGGLRSASLFHCLTGYHWNGNAETFYLVGEGMSHPMVKLLNK